MLTGGSDDGGQHREQSQFGFSPPEPSPLEASTAVRQRAQVSPLFLRPTELADGLALKESRYRPKGSPCGSRPTPLRPDGHNPQPHLSPRFPPPPPPTSSPLRR